MDIDEVLMFDEVLFKEFLTWLKAKLMYTTLLDILKDKEINFNENIILIHHSW